MCKHDNASQVSHNITLVSSETKHTLNMYMYIFLFVSPVFKLHKYGSEVIQSHITLKLWYLDDITDYIFKKGYIVNVTVPLWLLGESNAKVGASLHILSNQSN